MRIPQYEIHQTGAYRYIDEGPSTDLPTVVLLHGMLGDLSNWAATIGDLSVNGYRVVVPVLPVYGLPLKQTSVQGLSDFVHEFLTDLDIENVTLVGNSLGGQVAILYALSYPERVAAMVLSGSSGIYEAEMGTGTPRRRDREFIRERAAVTFFEPRHVTDELVDDMVDIINDRARVARLIKMARSTKKETVASRLSDIRVPTLLVWGRNDLITPPDVADEFRERIENSELHLIDKCGHAPMIERPETFNPIMISFLRKTIGTATMAI
ncbi:MAG: alpha/beta fold hydrolase [Rhodothermales bacterium]